MKTAQAIEMMIDFYSGDAHDVNHFLKVFSYARTIGAQEGLDTKTQHILEITAITHDIACPLCREKYGKAEGKLQELEGPALAEKFLQELGFESALIERVCWLVGHHHSPADEQDLDHQILLEADFLVNAEESCFDAKVIENANKTLFRTASGKRLLEKRYLRA